MNIVQRYYLLVTLLRELLRGLGEELLEELGMGMFDSVHYDCPACGESNEYQSKCGEKALKDYCLGSNKKIPIMVLADIIDESEKGKLICEECESVVRLKVKLSYRLEAEEPDFENENVLKYGG